jgi:HSP20 family protein
MALLMGTKDSFEQLAKSMGQMIDDIFRSNYVGFRSSKAWEPPVNIYEDAEALMVCVELAGMRREEIDVQVSPGRLTVRGSRPDPQLPDGSRPCRLHLLEIHHGPFARSVDLPGDLDVEGAHATYQNGYLWIRLPKKTVEHLE